MRRPFFLGGPQRPARPEPSIEHLRAPAVGVGPASESSSTAGLRVVVLPGVQAHTVAALLADQGHDVTLIDWSPGARRADRQAEPSPASTRVTTAATLDAATSSRHVGRPPRLRRLPALAAHRPDTWIALGRRLRGMDAIVVPQATMDRSASARVVLAIARGALPRRGPATGHTDSSPRPLVLHWPVATGEPELGALLQQLRPRTGTGRTHLTRRPRVHGVASLTASVRAAILRLGRAARPAPAGPARRGPGLRYLDVVEQTRPTAVLLDDAQAERVRRWARHQGLHRAQAIGAWDAAGGLAALLLADRGDRAVTLLDQSGSASPLRRWAADLGFDVRAGDGDLVGGAATLSRLDVPPGSIDVISQLYPALVAPGDVDLLLADAAWLLRGGGLLVITLALQDFGLDAFAAAELRALVARAHDAGFVLVGDIDDGVGDAVRGGAGQAGTDAPYGLVRLTLRRRP